LLRLQFFFLRLRRDDVPKSCRSKTFFTKIYAIHSPKQKILLFNYEDIKFFFYLKQDFGCRFESNAFCAPNLCINLYNFLHRNLCLCMVKVQETRKTRNKTLQLYTSGLMCKKFCFSCSDFARNDIMRK
jgi:hypothetical protein